MPSVAPKSTKKPDVLKLSSFKTNKSCLIWDLDSLNFLNSLNKVILNQFRNMFICM